MSTDRSSRFGKKTKVYSCGWGKDFNNACTITIIILFVLILLSKVSSQVRQFSLKNCYFLEYHLELGLEEWRTEFRNERWRGEKWEELDIIH